MGMKFEAYQDCPSAKYQNGGLVLDGKEFWGGYDGEMPNENQIRAIADALNMVVRMSEGRVISIFECRDIVERLKGDAHDG